MLDCSVVNLSTEVKSSSYFIPSPLCHVLSELAFVTKIVSYFESDSNMLAREQNVVQIPSDVEILSHLGVYLPDFVLNQPLASEVLPF